VSIVGIFTIDFGDIAQIDLYLSRQPVTSVLECIYDVVSAKFRLPADWQRSVRESLNRDRVWAMSAVRHGIPMPLLGAPGLEPQSLPERMDQLHDEGPEPIMESVMRYHDSDPPAEWRSMMRQPGLWVEAAASAMLGASGVVDEQFPRAAALLDREERRIDAAQDPEARRVLLESIPGFTLDGARLSRSFGRTSILPATQRFALVPMLSGPSSFICGVEVTNGHVRASWLGYRLPGMEQLLDSGAEGVPVDSDPLALLLGRLRAAMLRSLNGANTMYGLAEALSCPASTATYHCGKLVDAGLVTRHRIGNTVEVTRTERGTALVELMAPR
jgi:hypothetical protein